VVESAGVSALSVEMLAGLLNGHNIQRFGTVLPVSRKYSQAIIDKSNRYHRLALLMGLKD
jgi:hypothetical protein